MNYQYETIELTLELLTESPVLTEVQDFIVTFRQKCRTMEKHMNDSAVSFDPEANTINLTLTQRETGAFEAGRTAVQVNILHTNGERVTSDVGFVDFRANLHEAVMV